MNTPIKRAVSAFTLALVVAFALVATTTVPQGSTNWNDGDVFVGIGGGQYKVYSNTGTFKETISQGQPADGSGFNFATGCAFNAAGDKLYTTNFTNSKVVVFHTAFPHSIAQTISTAPGANLESIVFALTGDFYVGHANGDRDIKKFNAAGTFQQTFDVATEVRGSDWIDLAANQTTMLYTSEGRRILQYNVLGNAQLPDYATLPGSGVAYALRLLPPGLTGLLVADNSNIKRLDALGNVVQTYDATGENSWFALNLDPNSTSFWSAGISTGNFYRFNIMTGAIEVGPINASTGGADDRKY